jgi:hypothetical protein
MMVSPERRRLLRPSRLPVVSAHGAMQLQLQVAVGGHERWMSAKARLLGLIKLSAMSWIACAVLALGGCGLSKSEKASLSYKLTVGIEVEGTRSSAAAIQAIEIVGIDSGWPTQTPLTSNYFGEAIEIPVRGGGIVFAAMANPGLGSYGPGLLRACGILGPYEGGTKAAIAVREFEGSCDADINDVLLLVYMSDPRDPKTMRNARQMRDIKIVRVTLTKVDTPVVIDLPAKYPWLSSGSARFSVLSEPAPITIFANAFHKRPEDKPAQ